MNVDEHSQKYSYDDYQKILKEMSTAVKKYKNKCIEQSKSIKTIQNIIEIPIKIFLGTAIGGGVIELITKYADENLYWVKYLRFSLELMIACLIAIKDFKEYEKKRQKYLEAQSILSSFHSILHQQILIKKGYEGNRADILKQLTDTFENIKTSNIIIQEFGIEEFHSPAVSKDASEEPSLEALEAGEYNDAVTEASDETKKQVDRHFETLFLKDMMDRM